MFFDDLTTEELMETNEFSRFESLEEILDYIEETTFDELEKETTFLEEFPMPIYAEMRMRYLIESEDLDLNYLAINLYKEKKLVSHLMETQRRAIHFIMEMKPEFMKAQNIISEDDPYYPTMMSALREIVIKEIVEA